MSIGGHGLQTPFWQAPPQTLPHPAQFFGSLAVSTHAPPHSLSLSPHVQPPPWHVAPVGHAFAQAPQCCSSLSRSTHSSPHAVVPEGQTHLDATHAADGAHAWPHFPQLS